MGYKYLDATAQWSDPATSGLKYLMLNDQNALEWAAPDSEHKFLDATGHYSQMELAQMVNVNFYDNGTLVFSTMSPTPEEYGTPKKSYTFDANDKTYNNKHFEWSEDVVIKHGTTSVEFLDRFAPVSMYYFFYGFYNLTSLDLSNIDTSNLRVMLGAFRDCSGLKSITFGDSFTNLKVTDFNQVFMNCSTLENVDLTHFDMSNAEITTSMFQSCHNLVSVNFSTGWGAKATKIITMLKDCEKLSSVDLGLCGTTRLSGFYGLFDNCSALKTVNVDNLTFDSSYMNNGALRLFYGCSSLETIYCSNDWTTNSYIRNASNAFTGCTSLVGDIAYDETKTTGAYCTPDGGYFTRPT